AGTYTVVATFAGGVDYTAASAQSSFTIDRATLTVSAAGRDRVYDGSTSAGVSLSDDRAVGDLFTVSYASATFADKNVGSGKPIDVNGISISGPDAGNYTFNT